jgi:hypothetical protein
MRDRVADKIGIAPAETLNTVLTKIACILNIGEEHIAAK